MNNEVIAYSYLAALNNLNRHKDYLKLYKDIILNTIFEISNTTKEFLLTDVRIGILEKYSIDMPEVIIERTLRTYVPETEILVTSDGAVFLKKVFLDEFRENIRSSSSEIAYLEENFHQYLISNSLPTECALFDLINLYKSNVLNLSPEKSEYLEKYKYQLEYLNIIEKDKVLSDIFRKVIWGAILSSCITNSQNMINSFKDHILLLDTSFVISLLGLHTEFSNRTCTQVIEISKELGFKFRIFDQTIAEAKNLILETSEKLKENNSISSIFENDITRACYFNHKITPTDLERIAHSINDLLFEKFNYKIEHIEKLKTKVENSSLYKYYIETQNKDKLSAFHDTAAIEYVQNCRRGKCRNLEEAKCWFVQDRRNRTNNIRANDGMINERISSHSLLLMLWMNKPSIMDYNIVTEIEFLKLLSLSVTFDGKAIAIIKEFESNLTKYSIEKITPEENARIMRRIVSMSINEIQELNVSNPIIFNENIRNIIQEQLESEIELVSSYESVLLEKNNIILEKHELADYYKQKNEVVEESIKIISVEAEKEKLKTEKFRHELEKEKEHKIEYKLKLAKKLEELHLLESNIKDKVIKLELSLKLFNLVLLTIIIVYIIYLIFRFNNSWNYIEPVLGVAALIGLFVNLVIGIYNKKKEKSIPNFTQFVLTKYHESLIKKNENSFLEIKNIPLEIKDLESRIKDIELILA